MNSPSIKVYPLAGPANRSSFLTNSSLGVPELGVKPQYKLVQRTTQIGGELNKNYAFNQETLRDWLRRKELSKIPSPYTLPRIRPKHQSTCLLVQGKGVSCKPIACFFSGEAQVFFI